MILQYFVSFPRNNFKILDFQNYHRIRFLLLLAYNETNISSTILILFLFSFFFFNQRQPFIEATRLMHRSLPCNE